MNTWDQFDEFLRSSSDSQLWGEHLVIVAGELLSTFDSDDWRTAEDQWKERDATWQMRFADSLLDGDLARTAPILVKMLEQTPHASVAFGAADSLRASLGKRMLPVSTQVIARIQQLHSKSSGLMRDSLRMLLEHVQDDSTL